MGKDEQPDIFAKSLEELRETLLRNPDAANGLPFGVLPETNKAAEEIAKALDPKGFDSLAPVRQMFDEIMDSGPEGDMRRLRRAERQSPPSQRPQPPPESCGPFTRAIWPLMSQGARREYLARKAPRLAPLPLRPWEKKYITLASDTITFQHWRESFPRQWMWGAVFFVAATAFGYLGVPDWARPLYIGLWLAAMLGSCAGLAYEWSRSHAEKAHKDDQPCVVLRRACFAFAFMALIALGMGTYLTVRASALHATIVHHTAEKNTGIHARRH